MRGLAEVVERPNVGGQVGGGGRAPGCALSWTAGGGPQYLVPTLDRPRWLIRVQPQQVTTWSGGGWHPRYLASNE